MNNKHLAKLVFLTQTDTTIGFVSQNKEKLTAIKKRPSHKHYIKAVNSLWTLKQFTRVPAMHKNRVRRSCKTTFIMPNTYSYRVIKEKHHLLLLDRLTWAYTTSANLTNHDYNASFAKEVADVIVEPLTQKSKPSSIYKLGIKNIQRIR